MCAQAFSLNRKTIGKLLEDIMMGKEKKQMASPKYKQVSAREKYCFGIGAIGKDAICNLVGAFLMLYFKIGRAHV